MSGGNGESQPVQQSESSEQPESAPSVKISLMGSDAKIYDFVEGRTVGDWLTVASIKLKKDQAVSLNGDTAELNTPVEPNSIIVVADKISNG